MKSRSIDNFYSLPSDFHRILCRRILSIRIILHKYMKSPRNCVHNLSDNTHERSKIYYKFYQGHCLCYTVWLLNDSLEIKCS